MKTNDDFKEIDNQASKEFVYGDWSETCQTCNGLGYTVRMHVVPERVAGFSYENETCPNCEGSGEINYEHPAAEHGKTN